MMTRHEKWVHERNLEEIVDRVSELLISIVLLGLEQVNEQYLSQKNHLKSDPSDDISF